MMAERESDEELFVEELYVNCFTDVQEAMLLDPSLTGRDHYRIFGQDEKRLQRKTYLKAIFEFQRRAHIELSIDTYLICKKSLFVVGWILDIGQRMEYIELFNGIGLTSAPITRYGRPDVASAKSISVEREWGFFAMVTVPDSLDSWSLRLRGQSQHSQIVAADIRSVDRAVFRDSILYHLSLLDGLNRHSTVAYALDNGLGQGLLEVNRALTESILPGSNKIVFQPDNQSATPSLSLIVCLFGRIDYIFLQCCLFQVHEDTDFEFIYVLNSPVDADRAIKEACMASHMYKVRISIIIMPANVGFSAANNEGARNALSNRLLFVNPDVFPVYPNWRLALKKIHDHFPAEQTRFFGFPLLYDDGSLMHIGMKAHVDSLPYKNPMTDAIEIRDMIRIEHDLKGMHREKGFIESKKVFAITGALICIEKELFDHLGGFDITYIFGHYEDADLCRRVEQIGAEIWVHNIPFYHLEGKGSTKLPIHETTQIINRWKFSERWLGRI